MRRRYAGWAVLVLGWMLGAGPRCAAAQETPAAVTPSGAPKMHTATDWELKPSMKYDALCLLNVLSGDPFYLRFLQPEYDHFHPLFTPQENAAFVAVKHAIKDEGGGIVSAQLSLYYSTVPDQTLTEMIRTAKDSSAMKAAMEKTPYWDADAWKSYDAARPALVVALEALQRVGFEAYWRANALPKIQARIAELQAQLPQYNIIPTIEHYLGKPLPSATLTVYVLAYVKPHGIRITGLNFLTDVVYPFSIVLHVAIHEPMHPPFDKNAPAIKQALALLEKDPTVVDKVEHHDRSFGYNSEEGYIDEDSVQALEAIISEQFGVGRNPCEYWKQQDGGMHWLAAAIYTEYKQQLAVKFEPYPVWLVQAVNDGDLRGEKLRAAAQSVLGSCSAAGQ